MINKLPLNSALIIIDVQKGFDDPVWGERNNLEAEKNINKLLGLWRKEKRPIFHVKHNSLQPGSPLHPDNPGNEIKKIATPLESEPLIKKTVNSAFIGTDLEKKLRKDNIETIVLTGFTTDHCVSTTARMASNLGFTVYVVSDATATFERKGDSGKCYTAEDMHEYALVSLQDEFATIIDTSSIIKALEDR